MSSKGYVYMMYDTDDWKHSSPIYIGKTNNSSRRLYRHFKTLKNGKMTAAEYDSVKYIRIAELPTYTDAGIVERFLIGKYLPVGNTQMTKEGTPTIFVDIASLVFETYSIEDIKESKTSAKRNKTFKEKTIDTENLTQEQKTLLKEIQRKNEQIEDREKKLVAIKDTLASLLSFRRIILAGNTTFTVTVAEYWGYQRIWWSHYIGKSDYYEFFAPFLGDTESLRHKFHLFRPAMPDSKIMDLSPGDELTVHMATSTDTALSYIDAFIQMLTNKEHAICVEMTELQKIASDYEASLHESTEDRRALTNNKTKIKLRKSHIAWHQTSLDILSKLRTAIEENENEIDIATTIEKTTLCAILKITKEKRDYEKYLQETTGISYKRAEGLYLVEGSPYDDVPEKGVYRFSLSSYFNQNKAIDYIDACTYMHNAYIKRYTRELQQLENERKILQNAPISDAA